MFKAELEGVDELDAKWRRATNVFRDSTAKAVMTATKEGAAEARSKHSFKNRTGDLEESIKGVGLGWTGNDVYEGEVRAHAAYASFVEKRTRPHVIVVRSKRFLHWEEPQGDHHFAKVVHHPGTKAQPFMHHAYYKTERALQREIEVAVDVLVKGFSE